MIQEQNQIPIMKGLFTWPSSAPQLIGGRCRGCGTYFFPTKPEVHHPTCKSHDVEEVMLSRRGKLFSYTIHYYQGPPPFRMEPFQPYAIGAVELPEKLRVLGMLTGVELQDIEVGKEVELVTGTLYQDENKNAIITWKWKLL